jgi:hypothetical protein
MSSERVLRGLSVVALAASALGCADLSRGSSAPPTTTDGAAAPDGGQGALSFAADVLPLLARCKQCHVPDGQAGDSALVFTGDAAADYATVIRFVDTAAPAGSRLLAKASGAGHGGGTVYAAGSPEYETLLDWIQQGAPP